MSDSWLLFRRRSNGLLKGTYVKDTGDHKSRNRSSGIRLKLIQQLLYGLIHLLPWTEFGLWLIDRTRNLHADPLCAGGKYQLFDQRYRRRSGTSRLRIEVQLDITAETNSPSPSHGQSFSYQIDLVKPERAILDLKVQQRVIEGGTFTDTTTVTLCTIPARLVTRTK